MNDNALRNESELEKLSSQTGNETGEPIPDMEAHDITA